MEEFVERVLKDREERGASRLEIGKGKVESKIKGKKNVVNEDFFHGSRGVPFNSYSFFAG